MIIIGGLGTTLGPIFGVIFIRLLDSGHPSYRRRGKRPFPSAAGLHSGIAPLLFGAGNYSVPDLRTGGDWRTAGSYFIILPAVAFLVS